MSGWIKLHRGLTEWEWYTDANTMRVFIHCLLKANHTDKKWRGHDIKRGQFIGSNDSVAKDLNLTVSKVRTSINKLKLTGEMTIKSSSQHTVFTIENYDSYQTLADESQTDDKRMTNESQTDSKQIAATKNLKNEKNEKEGKKEIAKSIDFSMFNMSADEIAEVRRIRTKNKGGALTQRIVNALAKEFDAGGKSGYSLDDMLTEWEVRGWKSFKAEWMQNIKTNYKSPSASRKDDNIQKALNDIAGFNNDQHAHTERVINNIETSALDINKGNDYG